MLRAVVLRAVVLRAVVLRAVVLRAVVLRAVVLWLPQNSTSPVSNSRSLPEADNLESEKPPSFAVRPSRETRMFSGFTASAQRVHNAFTVGQGHTEISL